MGVTEQWWEKSTPGYSQPSQSGAEEEQLVRGGQRRSTQSEGGRGGAPSQRGAEEEHLVRGGREGAPSQRGAEEEHPVRLGQRTSTQSERGRG